MIPGVDVFEGYGAIDWARVAASGVRFAWVKCWEGNEGKDPHFERNVQHARDAGVAVGAYHFAFPLPDDVPGRKHAPNRGPREQAQLFYDACRGLGAQPGELAPAIDLEWPPPEEWTLWGCNARQINEWSRVCCERMTELWGGRPPVIYTYPHWWQWVAGRADVSWAVSYPLWIANWTHLGAGVPSSTARPIVPFPWTEWSAWQYSAEGSRERIDGIPACPIDRDVMRNERVLQWLLGQEETTDPGFSVVRSLPCSSCGCERCRCT